MNDGLVRLQKYISDCGIASRRKAEELILHNKIMVNHRIVNNLGYKVNPKSDIVELDGKTLVLNNKKIYVLLNKPIGYITTVSDQFKRPTVMDLVKDIDERIYPVGRLDYNTSGLLLLTNDGELANIIMHPKYEIDKTYVAKVKGIPDRQGLEKLRKGIKIDDYITSPSNVSIISSSKNHSTIKITIHEGKNRQVRKMFEQIGHKVIELKRISLGKINIEGIKEGTWRYLTKDELNYLRGIGD